MPVVVQQAADLLQAGFQIDPRGPRHDQLAVELRELFREQEGAGALSEAMGLTVYLHRALGFLDQRFLVFQLFGQPLGGLAGGVELGLKLIVDIGLGQLIGHARGQHRIQRADANLDDVGPLHPLQAELPQQDIDGAGHLLVADLFLGGLCRGGDFDLARGGLAQPALPAFRDPGFRVQVFQEIEKALFRYAQGRVELRVIEQPQAFDHVAGQPP